MKSCISAGKLLYTTSLNLILLFNLVNAIAQVPHTEDTGRNSDRIKLDEGWKFMRYPGQADGLIYDVRPEVKENNDSKVADSRPTEAEEIGLASGVLKTWILPTGNNFIRNPASRFIRPAGDPGSDFPFVQANFDDSVWEDVEVPHDWAIKQPFYIGDKPEVGGGMGRLPSHGVAWYRKKLEISETDKDKMLYLDIDGAMSYAMVWVNGHLAGGWPYGYNSFRINLTPYLVYGKVNQLAIRLDNPNYSARWYPGGGLYRNVWLTRKEKVHVAQWGSFITTPEVSSKEATIQVNLNIENNSDKPKKLVIKTHVSEDGKNKVLTFEQKEIELKANQSGTVIHKAILENPRLWGPPPTQTPNLYMAITEIFSNGQKVDEYRTSFGIRQIKPDPEKGLLVNNQPVRIQGVNQHHDLGALGAAFNERAAERQLELLRELGCNAIRMAHNPPAPELLDLTDRMGFLVIDEVFDSWERKKTPHDFHLIFPDWHEQDTRSMVRRDRNHPSVIMWSFGNEVGEQYTEEEGARLARKLLEIVHEEDHTRPASASQNFAKPDMPFSEVMDFLSLNYQGEGIRDAPAYAHLKGIKTSPLYPAFHEKFPEKLIVSSETASAVSTRGAYLFPVTDQISAPVENGKGGNPETMEVSSYELYTAQFGASPDKVFTSQDKHPYVAGEFVWTGWDYLGEPTPYYRARSSYSGIIDLAGFKKDRFYLYQSRWRPEYPMAHILPHWNWPERKGLPTPVHVFTSGDEGELFINGRSLGIKKKGAFDYRLRWDDVKYEEGELKVITYKNGRKWAESLVTTTGPAHHLQLTADKITLKNDGNDLIFVTLEVLDKDNLLVPDAQNSVSFDLEGAAEIVATDNGNPADLVSFASLVRKAHAGKALVILRGMRGKSGEIRLTAHSSGVISHSLTLSAN